MDGLEDVALAMLMRAAIAGDEAAYGRFLHRAAALVRAYARRKVMGSEPDPEDIVQETLLAIHLKRHTWRSDQPILPWLFGIARFKLIDGFRRRGRQVSVSLDEVVETLAAPEEETVSRHEIDRAVDRLPPGQRAVVRAISVDGRSIAETASSLGMAQTAVRVALHRGLTAISRHAEQS